MCRYDSPSALATAFLQRQELYLLAHPPAILVGLAYGEQMVICPKNE